MTRRVLGTAAWWLLIATLVVLPFESRLPFATLGRFVVTPVELVWGLALGTWLLSLVAQRRRPYVPRIVAVALIVLLIGNVASALVAPGLNVEATVFVGRSAAGWLLFLAVADMAWRRSSKGLGVAIVAGATVSAAIGLVVAVLPPSVGADLGIRDFGFLDTRRLVGTLEYPNSAAMYYEAAAILAIGLLAVVRGRARLAVIAAATVALAAMILTLSRGAVVGAASAVTGIAAVAFITNRRRLSALALGTAAAVAFAAVFVQFALLPAARVFTDAQRGLFDAAYAAPAVDYVRAGEMPVEVTVTNEGTLAWNSDGTERYRLGYHWMDPGTQDISARGDVTFPIGPLAPGESTVVRATVPVPGERLGHRVAWDVAVDGKYFSEYGVAVVTTEASAGDIAPGERPAGAEVVLYEAWQAPSREELWRAAGMMIAERPVLGVGPGTFRLRYGQYVDLQTFDPRFHSNNLYLEVASTTGLLGLAAFAVLVLAVLGRLGRRLLRDGEWHDATARIDSTDRRTVSTDMRTDERTSWLWSAAVGAAVVAFLVHGLLDYFLGFNPTGGLFWAVLGLALAAGRPRPVV